MLGYATDGYRATTKYDSTLLPVRYHPPLFLILSLLSQMN